MNGVTNTPGGTGAPARSAAEGARRQGRTLKRWVSILVGAALGMLVLCHFSATARSVTVKGPSPSATIQASVRQDSAPSDVVVYASDLPKSALSEFDFWNDPASPGGRLAATPNNGDELDPPPENDPHVTFKVQVQGGVPYRCWIHMKVGAPKGKSKANMLWVQFSDAVDRSGNQIYRPGTGCYLTAHGPEREGWIWLACGLAGPKWTEPPVYFRASGEVTVRLQAGMEGVGFDQFLLSPAQFLEKPPSQAVVPKSGR